jgi:hypothetical protein
MYCLCRPCRLCCERARLAPCRLHPGAVLASSAAASQHAAPRCAPLPPAGGRPDGCATFWKAAKLALAASSQLHFSSHRLRDNVATIALLEPAAAGAAAGAAGRAAVAARRGAGAAAAERSSSGMSMAPDLEVEGAELGHAGPAAGGAAAALAAAARPARRRRPGSGGSSSSGGCSSSSEAGGGSEAEAGSSSGEEGEGEGRGAAGPPLSKRRRQHSRRLTPDAEAAPVAAAAAAAGLKQQPRQQQQQQGEEGRAAPLLVVANTHILFNHRRGDVKLAQVRTLLEAMQQQAAEALGAGQQQQQQQQRQQQGEGLGPTLPKHVRFGEDQGEEGQEEEGLQQEQQGGGSGGGGEARGGRPGRQAVYVLAGDMNSAPGSGIYRFLSQGELDCAREERKCLSGVCLCLGGGGLGGAAACARSTRLVACVRARAALQAASLCARPPAHPPTCLAGVSEGSSWQRNRWPPRQHQHQHQHPAAAMLGNASAAAAAVPTARPRGWTAEELELALGRRAGQEGSSSGGGGGPSGSGSGSSQQRGGDYVARHGLRLASAYVAATGSEPAFTSFHSTSCHTLDYIWFTPDGREEGAACRLRAGAALLPPDRRSLPPRGLPSHNWPSDHISLACDFLLEWW